MFELLLHQYMLDEFLKRIQMRKIKRAGKKSLESN